MIERFTTEEFERALELALQRGAGKEWNGLGLVDGEETYVVPAGRYARVVVRSSIDESGRAAEAGEDSIRLWLEVRVGAGDVWQPVKKLGTYTNRTPGWGDRLFGKLNELARVGLQIKRGLETCAECGSRKGFWITASGRNQGRPGAKCFQCQNGFQWMDEPVDGAAEPPPASTTPRTASSSGAAPTAAPSSSTNRNEPTSSASPDRPSLDRAGSEPPTARDLHKAPKATGLDEDPLDLFDQIAQVLDGAIEKIERAAERVPSDQQALAIHAPVDTPARLIASAGSGKTFVLERRYRYLLQEGLRPEQIVVVTFTKDMSTDMANRIIALNPSISGTAGEQQICSIHAFCNRVLAQEGLSRRIPDKSWEVRKILKDLVKELWPLTNGRDPSTARPTWEELYSAIANFKAQGLRAGPDAEWAATLWGDYHGERLSTARRQYDSEMQRRGWWDFIDMLYEMEIAINSRRGFLDKLRSRFKYCMVDEGQDTNHQAMRILTAIFGSQERIFIVGDPDQLLFRFTGATPEANMYEGFSERYPEGGTYFIETNYRSTHTIVDASNQLISHNYRARGGPYGEEFRKTCRARPDATGGAAIGWTFWDDQDEEAEQVASSIRHQIGEGRRPGDIFVAARTRGQLGVIEPYLTQMGVPFINITGGSFWQIRHVALVLNYLRVARDATNGEAFSRIYNIASSRMRGRDGAYSPTRWLGASFLRDVGGEYHRERIENAIYNYRGWGEGARDLMLFMDELEGVIASGTPHDAARFVIDHCVADYLKEEEGIKDEDNIGKLADLEVVADLAGKFQTLDQFFERVDAAIQAAQDARTKNWDEYVVLSTVHRLKGMERPVVYGVGWCENGEAGLLPHTYSMVEPPSQGVLNLGGGKGRVEDERCIAYVLVTRAQEEVFLSGFRQYRKDDLQPSRFAVEMGLTTRGAPMRRYSDWGDDDREGTAWQS